MIYHIDMGLLNMLYLYYKVEEVEIQRSRECGQIKFGL